MDQQPQHWSERAKVQYGAGVPVMPSVTPPQSSPPMQSLAGPAQPLSKPARSARRPLAGAGLVILVALISFAAVQFGHGLFGGGSTTYANKDFGFTFTAPEGWQEVRDLESLPGGERPDAQIVFGDPDGPTYSGRTHDLFAVAVVRLPQPATQSEVDDLDKYLALEIAYLEDQATNLQVVQQAAECNVNGIAGARVKYCMFLDSDPITVDEYVLVSGDVQYQIMMQSSAINSEKNLPLFDAALKSFAVGATD